MRDCEITGDNSVNLVNWARHMTCTVRGRDQLYDTKIALDSRRGVVTGAVTRDVVGVVKLCGRLYLLRSAWPSGDTYRISNGQRSILTLEKYYILSIHVRVKRFCFEILNTDLYQLTSLSFPDTNKYHEKSMLTHKQYIICVLIYLIRIKVKETGPSANWWQNFLPAAGEEASLR